MSRLTSFKGERPTVAKEGSSPKSAGLKRQAKLGGQSTHTSVNIIDKLLKKHQAKLLGKHQALNAKKTFKAEVTNAEDEMMFSWLFY